MISSSINTKIGIRVCARLGLSLSTTEPTEPIFGLPTEATDSQALNYDGLYAGQVDDVINQLFSDGYCTNCIIDLSNNGVPTAVSSIALAGLGNPTGMNNTIITD